MKLTKTKLKQLIKEELQTVLTEEPQTLEGALFHLQSGYDSLVAFRQDPVSKACYDAAGNENFGDAGIYQVRLALEILRKL